MIVRVSKGNANYNAFRTLAVGLFLSLVILVSVDPLVRIYDKHIRSDPWLIASVSVLPSDQGLPRIQYEVVSSIRVRGFWKAYIQTNRGRTCWGNGIGSYGPDNMKQTAWDWNTFFETSCEEPFIPYQVCVHYDVTSYSDVHKFFGPYCSELYDPRRKHQ